jgi:hypothetical protein
MVAVPCLLSGGYEFGIVKTNSKMTLPQTGSPDLSSNQLIFILRLQADAPKLETPTWVIRKKRGAMAMAMTIAITMTMGRRMMIMMMTTMMIIIMMNGE